MKTLNAPVYEVKQDSNWYQTEMKRKQDIKVFFKSLNKKFGTSDGFSFYHSEYFGVYAGTPAYEIFKEDVVKNPDKHGFYAIKKRSKFFKEIKSMIEAIEPTNPFKPHDEFGLNNITNSQWVENRWFFEVKNEDYVKGKNVVPVDYKEYLKIIIDVLDSNSQENEKQEMMK